MHFSHTHPTNTIHLMMVLNIAMDFAEGAFICAIEIKVLPFSEIEAFSISYKDFSYHCTIFVHISGHFSTTILIVIVH